MIVNLDEREWQQIMGIIAQRPWHEANPLLMKIGNQLQLQVKPPDTPVKQKDVSGNSGEHHAE